MGIGPKPIPRNRLTPKRLAKGLQELVSERRFRVAAKELGLRLAMEDGVANAANIIEHELRKYLREENLPPVLVKTAEM
jgi:UDP:flavonoid glycosyltransferase YjiC (YdhE family)